MEYQQIVKLVQRMVPASALLFGTVTAFNGENRTIKAVLEPSGMETGWMKCLQGAYADMVGIEVLLGRVSGENAGQYVVIGIIE